MTICIAAIGTAADGKEGIIFATDHMISIGNLGQFDRSQEKYKVLNKSTAAMLSGNPLIFTDLLKECDAEDCEFDKIKEKIHANMAKFREDTLQKQVLDTFHADYEYVKDLMKGPLQNQYANSLVKSVATFSLQSSILLVGFRKEEAQIVEISENLVNDYRDLEFGVIGSGSIQAMNTLMFQRHSRKDPLNLTLYNVYKAKRNAEVSVGVGKETDIMILKQEGRKAISEETMKVLSSVYEGELNYPKTHKGLNDFRT
jgi:hypothetical protein